MGDTTNSSVFFPGCRSDSHVSYYLQQILPECSLSLSLFIWLPNEMESPASDIFGKRGRHMELTSLESPIRLHNSRTLDPSTLQKPTFMQTSKQTNSPSKAHATSLLAYFLCRRCARLNSWCVLAYLSLSTCWCGCSGDSGWCTNECGKFLPTVAIDSELKQAIETHSRL